MTLPAMQYDRRETTAWITRPILVMAVVFATLPLWIETVGLYQYLGVEVLIWIVFALGFNLLLGYTGLPSFGHGAFFGIGAYAFGLAQFEVWANLWFCLAAAIVVTGAFGAVTALFLAHRRGIYFALMSIAFGQIFYFIASKWTDVTKGEDGLLNIARLPADFGVAEVSIQSNTALYYFCYAVMMVLIVLLWRLTNSPFGRTLRAIKQNETRVAFIGYPVRLYKWAAFTLSCGIAGLAGGLFAMAQEGAYINIMSLQWSGTIVLIVLIGGGFVSFWGPVLGVILYFVARDILGAYTEAWLLWFGLMFVVLVMFKPDGIAGMWRGWVAPRLRGRGATTPAPRPAESRS
ncbi:branched-chain amino acid ABC transporter permease [Thalassobaculum litoreum]|uniref:Branched-chain amino acid transport system permease protein n=1 Tax=Thalassobaculum litoreum DSM 18839 TaxID=1123362 RepID=A0A8G2BGB8_9PROT|nr:branched-chain amino acid ABC transporter permease [Thalassobaculum litoreum]SDF45242.1 branched-chain amino acid transport system permease protein [Thalassobaculum litoreum DSM 18839]